MHLNFLLLIMSQTRLPWILLSRYYEFVILAVYDTGNYGFKSF